MRAKAEAEKKETRSPKRATARAAAKLGLLSGAALGMSAGEVMATIIDFGSIPITLNWGASSSVSTNLNLDGVGGNELTLAGSQMNMMGSVGIVAPGMGATLNVLTNGSSFISPVAYGALIGTQPSSSFAQPGMGGIPLLQVMYNMMAMTYSTVGSFNLGSPQYIGFQFSYMSTLVNAWALLNITGPGFPTSIELLAGSFEDSGGAIAAGVGAPVPEPGTGGLVALGLGALGVRSMRLRKKEREEAAARNSEEPSTV